MKKLITITAALALTASFAGAANAATETTVTPAATITPASVSTTVAGDTSTTVTTDVYGPVLVEPGDGIDLPLLPLEITKKTYFYDKPNGKRTGALSSQFVSVTGNEILNQMTGDTWVEIYTRKGIG
uniref:hypothetical protein n=1 Tax=Paenibacillus sp. Marseille-Q4541 TaxID=2831522 RepID=UPI001BA47212